VCGDFQVVMLDPFLKKYTVNLKNNLECRNDDDDNDNDNNNNKKDVCLSILFA
jgi:hypothetical protein